MSKPFTPREYQNLIIDHIVNNDRCAVWAGMGMGKTSSTLTAVEALKFVDDAPTLVLAPLRVANTTWPEEAEKWSHTSGMKVVPITGTAAQRKQAMHTRADLYTTNYESLPWLIEQYGDRWPFRNVVADESTKLKGFRLRQGGMRARMLAQVAHTKINRFVELTGTPSPNGLEDLWGQMWFIDKGQRLGRTFSGFRERWFRPHPSGFGSLPTHNAQDEIQKLLKDVCLTVEAKDWFDLKAPIVNNIYVDLPARVRKHYEDMEKKMFAELDTGHELEAFNAAARTIKCLQMANGAIYTDDKASQWQTLHDEKLQALEEIVEESGGEPILVAYHFKPDLARLKKHFPKGRELDKNPQTLKDWNAGRIPLLFAHPQSAGHGLNLQDGGRILVFFGHWWNLEERLQIIERIGPTRQLQAGHNRNVFIHNIIAKGTVDEQVIERVETKREVQDILMDAMKTKGYKNSKKI